MKLPNHILARLNQGLMEIREIPTPPMVAYAVRKNTRKIMQDMIEYDDERRRLLLIYAKKDKEGNILNDGTQALFDTAKARAAYEEEIRPFATKEVDVPLDTVPWSEFEKMPMISGRLLELLEPMIEFPEDDVLEETAGTDTDA